MAWIANGLECIVGDRGVAQLRAGETRRRFRIGCDVVDQRERAARLQDAPDLAHEHRDVRKMMRRDAACDEIEAAILERQRLRVGTRRLHVGQPLGRRQLARFRQHLVGDIAGDHARHMRGEGRGRMSRLRWRCRAPASAARASPARQGGQGSRPWHERPMSRTRRHGRRTAAERATWSWATSLDQADVRQTKVVAQLRSRAS